MVVALCGGWQRGAGCPQVTVPTAPILVCAYLLPLRVLAPAEHVPARRAIYTCWHAIRD